MAKQPSSPVWMMHSPVANNLYVEDGISSVDKESVVSEIVYPIKSHKANHLPPSPHPLPPPSHEVGKKAVVYLTHTHKIYLYCLFHEQIIAELVGTYILVFAGCGSALIDQRGPISLVGMAVVWGLAVMVMIYTIGHVSGAHINPAVTIALAVSRKFPWKHVPAYVLGQVIGGILASLTLHALFGKDNLRPTLTLPQGDTSPINTIIWEFIITFILMFVVSGVATDQRAVNELAGVAVGATVLFNALIAGQVTGASMNPARSIGPAIAAKHFHSLWIYVVAPIFGAIAGSAVYTLIQLPDKYNKDI
ncbi:aquaporin NIP1-1-like [Magnolia sinica]|uniref:aquaporin NIP1-1-like n=1 Tax=Magnolia sinica TaxID=86752 RepID=UPI002659E870|nr:aquaporin NIP1-1-like [Magnolia sinica]